MHGKSVWVSSLLDGAMHTWDCPFLVRSFVVGSRPGAPRKGGSGKGASDCRGGGERQKAHAAVPPMWERDGQAPERQEHGPQRQGWPDAWELGYLGIWVSRARPCQPACWIWYCTRPAAWYREYLRLLQSDCLSTTACTLFACAHSVPPHQSRPALGADSQHMAALHKVVIDHSLPPLLNRSIIKLIMHAFAWRQRRSQPAPLELKVLSMGGGPKRCLLTVRTRRDGSNHPTLNHSTTHSLTHSHPSIITQPTEA